MWIFDPSAVGQGVGSLLRCAFLPSSEAAMTQCHGCEFAEDNGSLSLVRFARWGTGRMDRKPCMHEAREGNASKIHGMALLCDQEQIIFVAA
jgi:hypothetical protein